MNSSLAKAMLVFVILSICLWLGAAAFFGYTSGRFDPSLAWVLSTKYQWLYWTISAVVAFAVFQRSNKPKPSSGSAGGDDTEERT